MAFVEDFEQFLDLADFAEPIEFNGETFNGIFDNETYRVDSPGENAPPVDVQQPTVMCKTSDTNGMQLGISKIIRTTYGTEYIVETVAPDGTGMTILGLRAVSSIADRRDVLQNRHRFQRRAGDD